MLLYMRQIKNNGTKCETDLAYGYVSVLTFANLVYVMRKELDAEKINEVLKKLSLIFTFESFNSSD